MSKSYFQNVNYYYCMFKMISLTGMKFKCLVLQTWQDNDIAGYASALISSFLAAPFGSISLNRTNPSHIKG